MEIFENAGFSFTCGRTKMEIFEYDDVIHHIVRELRMLRKGCYRISIVLAFSRFETIRIRYVRARIFFEDGEKNRRFQKIRIRLDGIKLNYCGTRDRTKLYIM